MGPSGGFPELKSDENDDKTRVLAIWGKYGIFFVPSLFSLSGGDGDPVVTANFARSYQYPQ